MTTPPPEQPPTYWDGWWSHKVGGPIRCPYNQITQHRSWLLWQRGFNDRANMEPAYREIWDVEAVRIT